MPCAELLPEQPLTPAELPADLDNNVNWSPDGQMLVFDCRTESGIGGNGRLGVLYVSSGEVRVILCQNPVHGVGAPSFLSQGEVVAIHALPGAPYDFTRRAGRIVPVDGGPGRCLDSRDVRPPFTPGALRGGTHKHEPDASGEWVGFTYNDDVMKTTCGSDLRNVGVSRRGVRAPVERDSAGVCIEGESFSVLLTACVEAPRPGSDDIRRAEGDCWVGADGFRDRDGSRVRARAFRGLVAPADHPARPLVCDVFLVEVPDDLTVPGPLGPLEGTTENYPKPPLGARVRRLTRTADRRDPALRGAAGHLRAPADGRWIAFVAAGERGLPGAGRPQVHVVSPATGEAKQLSALPGGVAGDPRFSPDGRFVAIGGEDGALYAIRAEEDRWGEADALTLPNAAPAINTVVSPDSRRIAYNRLTGGIPRIYVADAPA